MWSVRAIVKPAFRHAERWQQDASSWKYCASDWQIVVVHSNRVLPEDVPADVAKTLPGIEYLTQLQLEGNRTDEAMKLLNSTAADLAKEAHGVILNPQEGTLTTPSGVKRFATPEKHETLSVLSLSWWFLDSWLRTQAGRESLVALLGKDLPEVLPRRYGPYEPPQYLFEAMGKAHFLEFLGENLHQTFVWYPHRPVAFVSLLCPASPGPSKRGFRANHLRIDFEHSALEQPGWAKAIHLLWQDACRLLKPFYGDVRILNEYVWSRGKIFIGPNTKSHPVTSWWWRGIPRTLGNAAVLGDVYQKLWPAFSSSATMTDGLAFASTEDWLVKRDLTVEIGDVPKSIAQPKAWSKSKWFGPLWRAPEKPKYPKLWPFEGPFLEE